MILFKKILIAFQFWLDYEKPMCRQMGLSMINPVMSFSVKFYTPDPAQLEEEYTRWVVIFDDKIFSFCELIENYSYCPKKVRNFKR